MLEKLFKQHGIDSADKLDHQRLLSLVNSMADGVIAVDHNMTIVLSNGSALNILDVNSSLKGRQLAEVVRPFDKNGNPVDIESLVAGTRTQTTNRDLLLHYDDNSAANLYLSIAPVHLGFGRKGQRGFVLLLRDITHEKSLEEERDEFISVISHELRTPIAIAEGNVSNALFVANKTPDGQIDAIKQALHQAHEQITFLADMVNDLSMLSRAERGNLTIEIEEIDIKTLVDELQETYSRQAKEKGLGFEAEAPDDIGKLNSSRLYVREILQNFITNSIKYTDKGSVRLAIAREAAGVRFTVADTGIGISKSDQEKLFSKFFRSEDWRTRKTGGTGLGLYVSKKLARLLHAEISVKSELGKGSTFSVLVPDAQIFKK